MRLLPIASTNTGILHTNALAYGYGSNLFNVTLYTRYPIVACALGLAREQRYLVYNVLHSTSLYMHVWCTADSNHVTVLYTRYPIVARRAWPLGRVRRASKGILHTSDSNGHVLSILHAMLIM